MGSLWRSSPMLLVQLFVQIEAAHDTVDELGNLSLLEFIDLNPDVNAFQRNFVNEVKRCDEMERKLRFFEEQILKERGLSRVLSSISVGGFSSAAKSLSMDELESRFEDLEKEIQQMNSSQLMLDRNYNELVEFRHVLSADSIFFSGDAEVSAAAATEDRTPLLTEKGPAVKLGFLTGVINRDKASAFERVLWRSTRGNIFLRQSNIDETIKDPQSGAVVDKNAFIIFYQGDRLSAKVKKICDSFGATIYPCPEGGKDRMDLLQKVSSRLEDLKVVMARSHDNRRESLSTVAVHLREWQAKVIKEKAIYHTMNMFNYDVGRKCLIAEGWCPQTATDDIGLALRRATQRSGALVPSILSIVPSEAVPPTHFQTTRYTSAFQEIVNAYGMPHYREVNPAVFTIVTFPFLFGVMFADVGHGILLFIFAMLLIKNEATLSSKKLNELVQMPFDGRYALLLMSFFSIYIGLIYNEFLSVPMNLFGSNWRDPGGFNANTTDVYMERIHDRSYWFGVDPAWKGAQNELDYYNSFKMKLSIILGVLQMSLGVCLSAVNAWNEKPPMKWLNLLSQFLPQILFLWSIFGYMCLLIIIKWSTNWDEVGMSPPMILPIVINMFLSPRGKLEEPHFIANQQSIQLLLVAVALICIPVMLLVKPLYLKFTHKPTSYHTVQEQGDVEDRVHQQPADTQGSSHGGHGEEFDFGEIMIHQVIHTIEYILGCISNTASYLRLWALSLAHSELSTVFWNRCLVGPLTTGSSIAIVFVGFAVWLAATFAVLMIMETLSAFLHALRLHWVEFQNKFFMGDGRRFQPFSYKRIMDGDTE